jgi:hypothetical protein
VPKVYKYRLLPKTGNHMDNSANVSRPFFSGDEFESHMSLHTMFANKFELLAADFEIPEANRLPVDADEEVEEEEAPKVAGVDVTADFAGAEGLGLAVIKTGKLYSVYDKTDLETPLSGGNALASKAKVTAFIASIGS